MVGLVGQRCGRPAGVALCICTSAREMRLAELMETSVEEEALRRHLQEVRRRG